jgi:hypothetical protein
MIYGHGNIGKVALMLMQRYGSRAPWFIEHILLDGNSWRVSYNETSWIWWHFAITRDGLVVVIEGGGEEDDFLKIPEIEVSTLVEDERDLETCMLLMGVQPYQRILSTWAMNLEDGGYYDTCQEPRVSTHIIYVEPYFTNRYWMPVEDTYLPRYGRAHSLTVETVEMPLEEPVDVG